LEPVIEYLFRWFPLPVEPGLKRVGNPGPGSPVLVTANYSLTVKRLRNKLRDLDCYILAAPTGGINNWCSSADGVFNAHAVYSAFKASRIEEVVENRRLVLPQLSAPGVSRKEVSELTGWKVVFGPVYAADIPQFLADGLRKTPEMHLYRFQLHERLDLALSMNFLYYLPAAAAFLVARKKGLARFSLLFWSLVLSDYLAFFALPTRYGWTKALINGAVFGAAIAVSNRVLKGALGDTRNAVLTCMGFSFMIGMDLAGITGMLKDEPLLLLYKLGMRKIGPFTVHPMEVPRMDEARCVGCGSCYDVCPRGVYIVDEEAKKARIVKAEACEMCRACVKQCPKGAITISDASNKG
jgi:NAD-dependent dihydropyrimidine dehydrogenase PreA subunit